MSGITSVLQFVSRPRYLVVLAIFLLAGILFAQENSGEKRSPAKQSAVESSSQQAAGRQSAYAANDAAGREPEQSEDENEQFKHSAMVKYLAKKLHLTVDQAYWISVLTNFAIVVALVGFGLKKVLPKMFQQRTAAIQKGMEEARRASEDANRRLREIEDRLSRLDADIAQLQATAARQADEDEVRQKAAAEEEQRRMIEAAEQEIAAAANAARRELKAYSAELAVSLAEKRIKIDAATDQELVRDFVDQLGRNGGQ